MPKSPKNSRVLYALLAVYIVVSLTSYVVNIAGFFDAYFNLHHRAESPFAFDIDTLRITSLRPEAQKAGLARGDQLVAIDGRPYAGEIEWLNLIRNRLRPGDTLRVVVRRPNGSEQTADIALAGSTRVVRFREWGSILTMFALPPLLCLLLGYWVVAARPRDPFAWMILFILSFTESFFSLSQHWWPGYWELYTSVWVQIEQVSAPLVLLLFGIYFPERWRLDRKHPWLKWLLLLPGALVMSVQPFLLAAEEFHVGWSPAMVRLSDWAIRAFTVIATLCIAIYCIALWDKSRTASTPDSRRRLGTLLLGSIVGLGSVLLAFTVAPLFGFNVQQSLPLIYAVSFLFLLFPFTLAYVVVVQRAMDVRILLRIGTKYALARATLNAVRTGLFVLLLFLLVRLLRAPVITTREMVLFAVVAGLFLLLRSRAAQNLSTLLDRKFFREAYNAEQLLAELSQRVRKTTDSGPLLEMVTSSLAHTLHIDKIAVLLRGAGSFQLQHCVGMDGVAAMQLPFNSTTVRNLTRINTPVNLYRENPDGWLLLASESERRLLDEMSAELLLPLPGREQLMGLITLGPKRSEEPYTPTDLRLLESVATQTGLALEIGSLARSLAREEAQRERIQREIEIAREVQERLFPQELPTVDGVSLAGHCRPAQGVGGDYYDLFMLDDGRMGLAIGDVSGKGISAALLMASLRASLRGMTLDAPNDLAVMMEKVNRLVYEASASNRYATFFFATYCVATRELVYVNAGHNAPFVIHQGNSADVRRLEAGGPVVGLLSFAIYEEQRLTLEPGDLLLAYTDGISEAMTVEEEEWGEERMLAAAQSLPDGTAQQILQHLFAQADRFTGKAPQYDDMTLLLLKLQKQ